MGGRLDGCQQDTYCDGGPTRESSRRGCPALPDDWWTCVHSCMVGSACRPPRAAGPDYDPRSRGSIVRETWRARLDTRRGW